MIRIFKDKKLEGCWRRGDCAKVRPDIKRRVQMKLDSMDAADCLNDLRHPPSNHLHSLHAEYAGCWAISVNDPWRLIFRYDEDSNDIYDIELKQYH